MVTLRRCCDLDRAFHRTLHRHGLRRRFYSTKGQDRWVVERVFQGGRDGYFVEIGAADGLTHSNTYILERDYAWRGIAIEPNPVYFGDLCRNRKCLCIQSCVDAVAAQVGFFCAGFLGGIVDHDTDNNVQKRGRLIAAHQEHIIQLRTETLEQLLERHGAPSVINYLSLDAEGAENRILSTFPFNKYTFDCLTVERPTLAIHKLLREAGYVLDRIHRYDGFYVSRERAAALGVVEQFFNGVPLKFF